MTAPVNEAPCFGRYGRKGESAEKDKYHGYEVVRFKRYGKSRLPGLSGLILPNLKMQGVKERCGFLNEEGRCGIHAFRPGLCRLFPLGRNYEGGKLRYFLLDKACPNGGTKVKVRKWLDVPDDTKYADFLIKWHELRRRLQEEIAEREASEPGIMKEQNMRFLHIFYEEPYGPEDFYGQFAERLKRGI